MLHDTGAYSYSAPDVISTWREYYLVRNHVYTLKKYIVHTHAKDGRKLFDRDPEIIYRVVAPTEPVTDESFIELPLGEGDVPFMKYLDALHNIGYTGFLTIEREVGDQPAEDIKKAVSYLRSLF